MKLIIFISVVVCSYAAKLDRTYLPPASAGSAGGSPGAITAPGLSEFGPSGNAGGFGQPSASGFGKTAGSPGFGRQSPSGGFRQPASGSAGFGQPSGPSGSGFNQPSGSQTGATGFGQPSGSGFGQSTTAAQTGKQGFGEAPKPGYGGQAPQSGFGGQAPQAGFGVQAPQNFPAERSQPERPQASADRTAEILRYDNQNDGETFSYSFETSNGISAEESGVATNGVQAQGGFSYTGDDGQSYRVTYTADENGFVPMGEHLPTPPPIPDEILRSIEENARAAAAGTQEGAYRPEEYENAPAQQYTPGSAAGGSGYQAQGQTQGASGGNQLQKQPQGQSGSNAGYEPSGPSGPTNQYQSFQGPAGQRPQAQTGRGSQGDSGYQYNRPQANSFGSGGQGSIQGPQFNQQAPQSSRSYKTSGSQVSQGPSASFPSKPAGNQGPAQTQHNNRPAQPQSPSDPTTSFPSGPAGNQGLAQPTQQYNRPANQPVPSGPAPVFNRPSSPQGSFGRTNQGLKPSSGTSSSGSSQGSLGQQQQLSRTMPGPSGYQYNRPGVQGPQAGPGQPGSSGSPTRPGFNSQPSRPSGPGQFPAARQPPSFNEKDGYKY